MQIDPQSDVINFLSAGEAFRDAPVTRVDTHLSHVFLAGEYAFKIKRAVKYDFADFSTVEQRRQACEDEVRINRRTAPHMYLGVVPLFRREGGVAWSGVGAPVEWAVKMKRFDAADQFDILAERSQLTAEMVASLADKIAEFHLNAEHVGAGEARLDSADIIQEIATAIEESSLEAGIKDKAVQWTRLAASEFERQKSLLSARARHGWVRRCHGDLHLANICLFEGEPTPFDAIEFNEALAKIDVLYDLAFLLMDLVRYDRREFANLVLNRYLSITRDYAGTGLLPLFQSLRAAVRAMVLSLPGQSEDAARRAARYLDLAHDCLAARETPRLIAVGGLSGSGKSVLAASLALAFGDQSGAIVLQSDTLRKRLHGVAPETRLSESAYSPASTQAVYRRLFKDAARALRAGMTVILDATFLDPEFHRTAQALARRRSVPFDGLWLTADSNILKARVAGRRGGASDANLAVLERQLQVSQAPNDWRIINAAESPPETLRKSLLVLRAPRL